MSNTILRYFALFIVCLLMQVLIFNQIAIFHVAIPIVFIYFIVRLPIDLKLPYVFSFSFLLGLLVDIFSDTPGVNALSCTLIAAIRQPIFYAYMAKDDINSRLTPGISTMGLIDYSKFLFTFVLIYCFIVFTVEYFSFADVKGIVIMASSSALLSFIILLAADCLVPVKNPVHKKS